MSGLFDSTVDHLSAATPHLFWNAESLWQALEPYLPGVSVEVMARADSTNSVLLERARMGAGRHDAPITTPGELQDAPTHSRRRTEAASYGRRANDTHPCLLVAEHQSLGRGRLGRNWVSAPGASLTFSLGLPMAPRDWSGLSLAVGVALADALEPPDPGRGARLGLKWPNDLWLLDDPQGGRKLGGVLVETVAVAGQRMVVVGVGLNVLPLPGPQWAAQNHGREATLAHGYGCLQELHAQVDAPDVLHRVALPMVRALQQFEREGFAGFAPAYARRDLLLGRRVHALDPSRGTTLAEGVAEGVAPNGALRLRDDHGVEHMISSGEVSVRLDDAWR